MRNKKINVRENERKEVRAMNLYVLRVYFAYGYVIERPIIAESLEQAGALAELIIAEEGYRYEGLAEAYCFNESGTECVDVY